MCAIFASQNMPRCAHIERSTRYHSCNVRIHHWVITTIREHIVTHDAAIGTNDAVRIKEASYLWVIVTALQIVEAGLCIEVIAAIPERVNRAQGVCHGAGHGQDITPSIVFVFDYRAAHGVDNGYHVALEILDIGILCSVVLHAGSIASDKPLQAFGLGRRGFTDSQ